MVFSGEASRIRHVTELYVFLGLFSLLINWVNLVFDVLIVILKTSVMDTLPRTLLCIVLIQVGDAVA